MKFDDKPLTNEEELDRFASGQVLKALADAYIKVIYFNLPKPLLLKYVTEAYIWFLESGQHSLETAKTLLEEQWKPIHDKAELSKKKHLDNVKQMIDKLEKEESIMALPEPETEKKDFGEN